MQIQAERGHLVAVDHQFHFRLVNLGVNLRRESEHPVGRGQLLQRRRELQNLFRLGGGGHHKIHREIIAPGNRRRRDHEHADAGNFVHDRLRFGNALEGVAFAFAPRLEHHAAKAAVRHRDLKRLVRFAHGFERRPHRIGVKRGLVDRGIRASFHDAENDALVFRRREFAGGLPV